MPIVALVTCAEWPHGSDDDRLLHDALVDAGLDSTFVAWDDSATDWGSFAICVVRSTWDYHHRLDEFSAWVERVGRAANLWNRPATLLWNSHKTYLIDLERCGIPIVPTVWLHPSATSEVVPDLASIMAEHGWERAVVKPAVSASAFETVLVGRANLHEGQTHIARLLSTRELMVQPFLASTHGYGERSHLFIDGVYSHSVKRPAMLGHDEPAPAFHSSPVVATPAEVALAERVLASANHPTLYARVDLVRDDHGALRLMELELVEPSMFFSQHPASVERMVQAIRARLP